MSTHCIPLKNMQSGHVPFHSTMIIKKLQTTYAFSYLYTKIKMTSDIQLTPINDAKSRIKNKALVLVLDNVCNL